VVPFSVEGPARGTGGDPLSWLDPPADLGPLFPHEFQAGVTVTRGAGLSGAVDVYHIEVLQSQTYAFTLSGESLPEGIRIALTNTNGDPVPFGAPDSHTLLASLNPGTYLIRVDGWPVGDATRVSYQLRLGLV